MATATYERPEAPPPVIRLELTPEEAVYVWAALNSVTPHPATRFGEAYGDDPVYDALDNLLSEAGVPRLLDYVRERP